MLCMYVCMYVGKAQSPGLYELGGLTQGSNFGKASGQEFYHV
jgi:hypothetical protein